MMPTKPYVLSVKAVLRDGEGRYLLVKRSADQGWNPGKWELPGGKEEAGETFEGSLRREVNEETGLGITLLRVAGVVEFELPDLKVACLVLEARPLPGEIRLSQEHDAYAWAAAAELPEMDLAEPYARFFQTYPPSSQEAG